VIKPEDIVEEIVRKFAAGAETCHTVDCVLVRLSSAFLEISDFVKDFPTTAREEELITSFLNHPEVLRILAGLAFDTEVLEEKIALDPRFKNLRPHTIQILHAVKRASAEHPSKQHYSAFERPPVWRVESMEQELRETEPETATPTTVPHARRGESSIRHYSGEAGSGFEEPSTEQASYKEPSLYSGSEEAGLSESLSRIFSPKACIALYIVMLLVNAYIFAGIPWIVFYGKQYHISIPGGTKITPVNINATGWDMTRFYIELWRQSNVRPPLFIAYFIGLLLAVIALVIQSPTLSTISGLAMLVGWYDFYTTPTVVHKVYIQKIMGALTEIMWAELRIGARLAGILAVFQLIAGTILIYKASR